MKVRQVIALQNCFLDGNLEDPRLTIGKPYTIHKIYILSDGEYGRVYIIDDSEQVHTFSLNVMHEFFNLKKTA